MTRLFAMNLRDQYDALVTELRRMHELESITALLGWDEEVNLPAGAGGLRAAQHAALAAAVHREGVSRFLGDMIEELHAGREQLDDDARRVVALAHKNFREATALPEELVARRARLGSESCLVWRKARENSDFALFRPYLEQQVAITREVAAHLGHETAPYDWCIDRHDPGLDTASVTALFDELRAGLIPLTASIVAKHDGARFAPTTPHDDETAQLALCREVTARLGFDYGRGRIDKSTHPFCAGDGADCRITTRFERDNPIDALFSSIHEAGHGMYAQGLDPDHAGDALGHDAGMGVHESQSRLWENQVARSAPFWEWAAPVFRRHLPHRTEWADTAELVRRANRVRRTLIRVDADEATYNQHILLRFGLERRLLDGSLAVRDLPEAWREESRTLLGLTPAHDGEGVLQDIHWSWGEFGYFPSYTLGNMLAASLWDKFRAENKGWENDFARGEFAPLLAFLRDRIHRHGRRHDARELCRRATGSELSPKSLLAHLGERYA